MQREGKGVSGKVKETSQVLNEKGPAHCCWCNGDLLILLTQEVNLAEIHNIIHMQEIHNINQRKDWALFQS